MDEARTDAASESGSGSGTVAEPHGRGTGRSVGSPRRRIGLAAVALAAVGALTLSGCAPLIELARDFASRATDRAPSANFERFDAQTPRWSDCGDGMECA